MKKITLRCCNSFREFAVSFTLASTLLGLSAQAQDTVYVTSFTGGASTTCPKICAIAGITTFGASSAQVSAVPGAPARDRTWYGNTTSGTPGPVQWTIQPTLNVSGAIYKIETSHNSGTNAATSCSQDVLVTLSTPNGALSASCTNTLAFQRQFGGPAWQFIGYITNDPGVFEPVITFLQTGGTVNNTPDRLYIDAFKFTEVNPCSGVAADVTVSGPLAANQTFVNVLGVNAAATNISVYADGLLIGELNSPSIVAGANSVPTSALLQDSEIKAQQSINGCVSALASSGSIVGSGANPMVKVFLTCWQSTNYLGPIGAEGAVPSAGIYYALKGSGLAGGSQTAPGGGEILSPSQCWQTVTFHHDTDTSVRMDTAVTAFPYDPYCALDGLTFAIINPIIDGGSADSGPYDIFVDQIKNGDVVIEDFENYTVDTTNRFSAPNQQASFPNPTSTYLAAPNSSLISSANSFDGTKSLRIRWQWNGKSNTRWARVQANATPGKNYPQLDTTKPITIRYLVLPVGETTNKLHFASVPANQTKATNETVTFEVAPLGEGPFTYQWSQEGFGDIPEATNSSYSITNVQLSNSGIYSVFVASANGVGCSASVSAKLTVTEVVAAPTISYTWNGSALQLNWTGTFNLESKTNLSQPNWTSVGVASGPYNVALTNTATFYRLRNP